MDCETGKGRQMLQGESPGATQATYHFQYIVMDRISSLLNLIKETRRYSYRSTYVVAKASASRTAQTIAENYEKCVFRRFQANEAIRHD
ncbi:hypothetical protein Pcac1_g25430 [Phytophthora cactorum]|nr:hypothetical protein Pcac1_g25430 [Phytophthora cactorum]